MQPTATSQNGQRPSKRLERTTFSTSRLLDFCSQKELTAQTGHDPEDWPLVILKEGLDNSLDACEEAGTAPQINVTVDSEGITITDNGPGIPPTTIDGILDFSVRISSREAYVSPTRRAQGNAMKTVLAMPFVLDGNHGQVDITANGQHHEITFGLDPIRQEPAISRDIRLSEVKEGTLLTVHWPDSACSTLEGAKARFLLLADDYTYLNPHLTLTVEWFGERVTSKATNAKWVKWRPSDPTSPDWYKDEDFERLLSAYIIHDQDRDPPADRYVSNVIAEFCGLTGSAKRKAILEETGLSKRRLSSLVNGEGLQHDIISRLLGSMRKHSKPVNPAMLGVIGRDHIEQRIKALGCVMESFKYKKILDTDEDGLPTVIETAFGWRGDGCRESRRIITGVNWAGAIGNPFRTLGATYGDGLRSLLEKRMAGADEPIVFLLHVAHPRVRYTDRGKSAVVVR